MFAFVNTLVSCSYYYVKQRQLLLSLCGDTGQQHLLIRIFAVPIGCINDEQSPTQFFKNPPPELGISILGEHDSPGLVRGPRVAELLIANLDGEFLLLVQRVRLQTRRAAQVLPASVHPRRTPAPSAKREVRRS